MQLHNLPVTDKKLMGFQLEFIGTDSHGGERHYLEHMMLNSNKTFTKEEMHRNISLLGGESLFSACTSQERIMFSGEYLKEDEQRVWELLRPVVNHCLFLDEEIEKERKIILEEYQIGKDQIFKQLWKSIGKLLGRELCVLGVEETIKTIDKTLLSTLYKNTIAEDHAKMFVQNCQPPVDLFEIEIPGQAGLKPIVPKGNHSTENKEMTSSVGYHTFDVGFRLSALLLEDYLGSPSGPLFKKIREERQLCYMVGAMTNFAGDFELSPYFSLYVVSNSNLDEATAALMEEFIVDDVELRMSTSVCRLGHKATCISTIAFLQTLQLI